MRYLGGADVPPLWSPHKALPSIRRMIPTLQAQMDSQVNKLHSRAKSLAGKFKHGCDKSHIDKAIVLDREALELCAPGHLTQSVSLTWLSNHLRDRYNQYGEVMDLEEAIVLARDALALCPPGHVDRGISLNNLANALSDRYKRLGAIVDLNEAISLGRHALTHFPSGHPDHSMCLDNLANGLSDRYKQLGVIANLHEAIIFGQDALALCPPGHPSRSRRLNNLANHFSDRYKQLGVIADLNEAIVLGREALALCPPGHPAHSRRLNNLASILSNRYKQLGAIVDLNEAIALGQEALALCPPGRPDRSSHLNNLGIHLSNRYKQLGAVVDLNEAITLAQGALGLCPRGHPARSMCLNNLASHVSDRYKQFGAIVDLNVAIVLARDALALCPSGHPSCSRHLNNLANRLCDRYKRVGTVADLDEAVSLARNGVSLCPLGHPHRSWSLETLASHLLTRYAESSESKDMKESFSVYAQLLHIPPTVSSADLSAARAWIGAAEEFRHPTLLLAYETTLRLLTSHLATLPSLPQHLDILKDHTSSFAMDAFSACLRSGSPAKAIELLEQGRGVFWNQLTRLRSPLDDVIASGLAGETLADKFTQLTSLIRNALESPGADQHDRVWCLNVELERVVADIRELPDLSRFLLPSLFSDLQKAASGGPVIVVNASKYGCDALVVLLDRDPVHIPLQITRDRVREMASEFYAWIKRAKLENVAKHFAGVLRELWAKVVSPITDFIQTILPLQSRIWWCPTAEFSLLPFHAAGSYRTGEKDFSDLYISSYTPTLTALIRARGHAPTIPTFEGPHFVAIGQGKAAGGNELLSIGAELANIGERVGGLATFRSIKGSDSSLSRVVEELNKNEWVHFACHGLPNRKQPFASAFALHDGHFTIEQIIRCEPRNAQFAYLSACHTTVGDEECPDEMIHLAAAMQFVGFRSVIGTMSAVDREQTERITSLFYDNMVDESGRLDHTRAAFALHKTMQTVKDLSFNQRILYIHIGA